MQEIEQRLHEFSLEQAREIVQVSATPGVIAREYLGLPEHMEGLTVVDLCAGASSLVPQLLNEGVNTFAVDLVYRLSADDLKTQLLAYLTRQLEQTPGRFKSTRRALLMQTIEEFGASYGAFPERYFAADVTNLNRTYFPDNFADFTVSSNGISKMADIPDKMFLAIQEAMRITKPGGMFIMLPIAIGNSEEIQRDKPLADKLQQTNFGEMILEKHIRSSLAPPVNRLKILKR